MSDPAPFLETMPRSSIVQAQTPLDVVNAALNDPTIQAVITKYLGGSLHGPAATLIGGAIGLVATHFGLQLSDNLTVIISALIAAAAGYGWQWLSKKYLAPATPVTQGPA